MVLKLLLVLIIVFVIFGAGKLPEVMGDLGKGIRALKDGMKDDKPASPPPVITQQDTDKPGGNA